MINTYNTAADFAKVGTNLPAATLYDGNTDIAILIDNTKISPTLPPNQIYKIKLDASMIDNDVKESSSTTNNFNFDNAYLIIIIDSDGNGHGILRGLKRTTAGAGQVNANTNFLNEQVLTLVLPDYSVLFTPNSLVFKKDDIMVTIDEDNFEPFQSALRDIFCMEDGPMD